MANYKETAVSGSSYSRCCEIKIINPLNATPVVAFVEQQATVLLDGKVYTERSDTLTSEYDPAKLIPMRDPTTGNLTGASTSFADVYNILYSAYIAEAEARDAAIAAQSS